MLVCGHTNLGNSARRQENERVIEPVLDGAARVLGEEDEAAGPQGLFVGTRTGKSGDAAFGSSCLMARLPMIPFALKVLLHPFHLVWAADDACWATVALRPCRCFFSPGSADSRHCRLGAALLRRRRAQVRGLSMISDFAFCLCDCRHWPPIPCSTVALPTIRPLLWARHAPRF